MISLLYSFAIILFIQNADATTIPTTLGNQLSENFCYQKSRFKTKQEIERYCTDKDNTLTFQKVYDHCVSLIAAIDLELSPDKCIITKKFESDLITKNEQLKFHLDTQENNIFAVSQVYGSEMLQATEQTITSLYEGMEELQNHVEKAKIEIKKNNPHIKEKDMLHLNSIKRRLEYAISLSNTFIKDSTSAIAILNKHKLSLYEFISNLKKAENLMRSDTNFETTSKPHINQTSNADLPSAIPPISLANSSPKTAAAIENLSPEDANKWSNLKSLLVDNSRIGSNYQSTVIGTNNKNEPLWATVLSPEQATILFNEMADQKQIPFNFPIDGCYARSLEMARIAEAKGIEMQQVYLKAPLGELLRVETNKVPSGAVEWNYHVAPVVAVRVEDEIKKMVIDPSISSKPITIEEWHDIQTTHIELTSAIPTKGTISFGSRYASQHEHNNPSALQYKDKAAETYSQSTLESYTNTLSRFKIQEKILQDFMLNRSIKTKD